MSQQDALDVTIALPVASLVLTLINSKKPERASSEYLVVAIWSSVIAAGSSHSRTHHDSCKRVRVMFQQCECQVNKAMLTYTSTFRTIEHARITEDYGDMDCPRVALYRGFFASFVPMVSIARPCPEQASRSSSVATTPICCTAIFALIFPETTLWIILRSGRLTVCSAYQIMSQIRRTQTFKCNE